MILPIRFDVTYSIAKASRRRRSSFHAMAQEMTWSRCGHFPQGWCGMLRHDLLPFIWFLFLTNKFYTASIKLFYLVSRTRSENEWKDERLPCGGRHDISHGTAVGSHLLRWAAEGSHLQDAWSAPTRKQWSLSWKTLEDRSAKRSVAS